MEQVEKQIVPYSTTTATSHSDVYLSEDECAKLDAQPVDSAEPGVDQDNWPPTTLNDHLDSAIVHNSPNSWSSMDPATATHSPDPSTGVQTTPQARIMNFKFKH